MSGFRDRLPSLSALVTFEAAARLSGFTAAARELAISQAAVSRQVRVLEEALGTPLFRRGRHVELTPAGAALAAALSEGLARIADTVDQVRLADRPQDLTVAATLAFSHFFLLPRLSAFRAAQPDLRIRVISQDAAVDLRHGGIDVLIRFGRPPFADGRCVARRADRCFPVASPTFRERLAGPLRPQDLPRLPLIGSDVPDPSWLTWPSWLRLAGIDAPRGGAGALQFNHYTDAISAALNGEGVALGWEALLAPLLREGRLVRLTDAVAVPADTYCVVVPGDRRSPAADAFVDWIAGQLSGPPGAGDPEPRDLRP